MPRCPTCGAMVTVAHGDDPRERTRYYLPLAEVVAIELNDMLYDYGETPLIPSTATRLVVHTDKWQAVRDAMTAWEVADGTD